MSNIIKTLQSTGTAAVILMTSACQQSSNVSPSAAATSPISEGQPMPKISVQLWSVNEQIKQDFKGTLSALAAMGFEGVEFAGYFGPFKDDPDGLSAYLAQLGLEVSGAHVSLRHFKPAVFDQTVEFYQALGTPMLIVPNAKRAWDPQKINEFISDLNTIAGKLEGSDMGFGFHNYARELTPYRDPTFWDHVADSTSAEFILQLDVGWATYAGVDAAQLVRKYPGRTLTTHYKAKYSDDVTGKQPFIGQDTTDWPAVIRANIEVGGTQWLVVEQEEYPDNITQLQAVSRSKQGLDAILGSMRF